MTEPNDEEYDQEFLRIYQENNLEDILNESEGKIKLRVKDLQEGLADITNVAAYIASFLVEFFTAFEDGDFDSAPKMKKDVIVHLLNIFQASDCVIELIDVEYNEEDEEDE